MRSCRYARRVAVDHSSSRTSSFRSRRSVSSITALSETPVRRARILIHFRTSSSIVSVVLTFATGVFRNHDAHVAG
jgi:hypothetical protein